MKWMLYTKKLLVKLGPCVALTGAGISAEGGIPTFRSNNVNTWYLLPNTSSMEFDSIGV